jgi:hypothetical protein
VVDLERDILHVVQPVPEDYSSAERDYSRLKVYPYLRLSKLAIVVYDLLMVVLEIELDLVALDVHFERGIDVVVGIDWRHSVIFRTLPLLVLVLELERVLGVRLTNLLIIRYRVLLKWADDARTWWVGGWVMGGRWEQQ